MAGTASTTGKNSETVALFMAGNNSLGKYLLSISYEKRDSVLIKQHVASHTSTILIQHNLNLNGLFPADIILEINKTTLLSKSGECGKGEGRKELVHSCFNPFANNFDKWWGEGRRERGSVKYPN